jgi:hypothetical protein
MAAVNVQGANFTAALAGAGALAAPFWGGKLRATFDTYDATAGLDAGSTIALSRIPAGAVVLGGIIWAPTDSDATLSVGISGSANKYMAATAAAAGALAGPYWFGATGGIGTQLTADETIIVTVGSATYSGGVIKLMMLYVVE